MASALAARRQAVFKSVFHTEISQPTPYSTPSVRFTEEGQPWGVLPGTQPATSPRQRQGRQGSGGVSGDAEDQVRWDRAWHTITSRIQLPPSVAAEDSFGPLAGESQDADEAFHEALKVVLYPGVSAPRAKHTEDVLLWHTQQARNHFIQHVLPLLSACAANGGHAQILLGSLHTLEAAHRQYLYGLQLLLGGMREADSNAAMERFRHELHAMIGNSMSPGLVAALRAVMRHQIRSCLGVPSEGEISSEGMEASRSELVGMVVSLNKVGLSGESFQVLFAELMDDAMGEFIMTSYAGRWSFKKAEPASRALFSDASGGSYCTDHLSSWIENHFSRLAVEVLSQLGEGQVPWSDVAKWKEIALGRLATLRIHELYDIVLSWPSSREGLDDLRITITTPQRRLQLTDAFAEALQRRLLHPGCSTLKILRVYISMIRTFHALDHSKVLLDRVVYSLQLYLCQRNDAIRIVVTGLLADFNKEKEEFAKGKLVELARLLNDPSQDRRTNVEDEELDWDDMDWVPVPVDAAVNYKRPKSEDVVGTLIGALGSQDIFIKEFQGIMAERLLSQNPPFKQEVAVLKLLKKRFGENALQNCDVMLKDIGDSRKVDDAIAQWMKSDEGGADDAPSVHARVLSRLFWPALPREHFIVPQPVTEMQRRYEGGFEHLKSQRKLTWIDNMGTATVELALENREVKVECKTYHAAVIYAFDGDDGGGSSPARKTAVELEEQLQMDDELVGEALSFWVSQRVLREDPAGTFTVMETLAPSTPRTPAAGASTQGPAGPSPPAKKPMGAKEAQQRQVYWQFIKGMLTNSAAMMPAAQIGMMLKMLLPDGFPWGDDELREFLGEKVEEGELEFAGAKYKLAKK